MIDVGSRHRRAAAASYVAASCCMVLRSSGTRGRAQAPARPRARLCRTRADGARTGRLSRRSRRATMRRRSCATAAGRRAAVQHLPPSAGDHAERHAATRANIVCPMHRWTYDLRGRAAWRAAFRRAAVPATSAGRRCRTGTACCSTARATSRATSRAWRVEDLDFSGYVLDHVESARVQLQLEDVHRGLPRGLPRRAVPSGPRPVRHLRRPALGIRRLGIGADGRRQQRPGASPGTRTYERWHKAGARLPRRRARRRTARSGSRTTRTSWSSGIRTCSSSAR